MAAAEVRVDLSRLAEDGVEVVQMELPDLDGVLRGKFIDVSKVKPDMRGSFCTILYQLTPLDDVWVTRHSSFDNGFPDVVAVPDPSTATRWPWRPDTAAVVFDIHYPDGSPFPISPRNVLKRAASRFAETGYEPVFGVEYEAFVMHADQALMAQGRHHELRPLARMHNAYRLTEAEQARDLGAEFMRRMRGLGIGMDAFHTELGYGAIEFALSPTGPLSAADNAARAKTYFRNLCAERGLAATFMAKWKVGESGSGGHIHQSIRRDGSNALYCPDRKDFSPAALSHAAGLLATMPEFSVLFRPNINSYRRFDHRAWSPENASWGHDNRSAALRAIRQPDAKAFRFEHRVPGADANIYLAIAAMLAGGHHGLTAGLEMPAAAEGNAIDAAHFTDLPRTLPEATEKFRSSTIARDYFGEEFVEHYAKSRDVEWEYWLAWQAEQVTPFELKRYFDTI